MSSVFFEGNTYTFGATVSSNPGTGTTSYVFGGLSSGSTFGFILRAFNNFGFSNFVGPVVKMTESFLEESREMIGAFHYSWNTDADTFPVLNYSSGSTLNLFFDSENMSVDWWGSAGLTRTPAGITLPNGRNNGIIFTTPSDFNFYNIGQAPNLEGGATYVYSWYMNETLGNVINNVLLLSVVSGNVNSPLRKQILPVEGTWGTSGTILKNAALTGWVRYAFEFVANYGYSIPERGIYYLVGMQTPNVSGVRNYYLGSPLLEKTI
jgi:hypothetical protein